MWNFRTSELLKDIPAVIIFHFDESRGTEVLEECLPGYVGIIMSDGHSPYHGFAEKSGGTVTNAGCLNHARTRFARVLRANPELRKLAAEGREEVPACKAIELFKKIFREESKLKDACPDDRLKGRQEKVRPVFEELSAYIKSFGADDFDQSGLMYDALQYFINQEKYLRGFLDDPLIPAHNSACERDNAGFAVLRNIQLYALCPERTSGISCGPVFTGLPQHGRTGCIPAMVPGMPDKNRRRMGSSERNRVVRLPVPKRRYASGGYKAPESIASRTMI